MRQPSFDRSPRGPQGHNAGFQRATKQQKQVMMRLFGFFSSARAMQRRCFCPPETFVPPCSIMVS